MIPAFVGMTAARKTGTGRARSSAYRLTRFPMETEMFNTDFARRFAVLLCTVVMSATCVIGAVGPAHAGLTSAAAATTLVA